MRKAREKVLLLATILFLCIGPGIRGQNVNANVPSQKAEEKVITWEDKIFEKSVDYGSFACEDTATNRELVSGFFKSHPLKSVGTGSYRLYSVCHNNCAVLKSFPKTPLPFDTKTRGNGSIAIHVLVNEMGIPIYARSLNGNAVMRSFLQIRACKAEFRPTDETRQTVIFFCPGDKCNGPQPVQ